MPGKDFVVYFLLLFNVRRLQNFLSFKEMIFFCGVFCPERLHHSQYFPELGSSQLAG